MLEMGPLRVDSSGNLIQVSGSESRGDLGVGWNEYSNLLFIDQPAGTGLSYVNKEDNLSELPQVGM
jgi:carboxypeptidase D